MQTATATVAGRRRVSFTLPEPAATTFIPRDVESPSRDDAARRSTWPPTRTAALSVATRRGPQVSTQGPSIAVATDMTTPATCSAMAKLCRSSALSWDCGALSDK